MKKRKIIIILIVVMILISAYGYHRFTYNEITDTYDCITLRNIYITLVDFLDIYEKQYHNNIVDEDEIKNNLIFKEYFHQMNTYEWYLSLSPRLSSISYDMRKIADIDDEGINKQELEYLINVRDKLKIYNDRINDQLEEKSIRRMFGIFRKSNADELKAIFTDLLPKNNDISENDITDSAKDIIELTFTPMPKQTLTEGLPKEEWIRGKSIYFGNLSNQIESTLHLYIDNTVNPDLRPGEGVIYGFLEHNDNFYEIGVVSNYRIDDVKVDLEDRTSDGIKDIEIEGSIGSTYIEVKIVSFNENKQEWESLLTMGSPTIVDLDMDGREELIAGSAGILPPYIDIYRWNYDHFEKADIVEATKSDYASLTTTDGTWFIETGLYENSSPSEHKLYKYKAGKLIEEN